MTDTTHTELLAELNDLVRWSGQSASSYRFRELLGAGVQPNDETLARLIGFYRVNADLNSEKHWDRREILYALVVIGMVGAGRVADPITGDTWLHLVCAAVASSQDLRILLESDVSDAINRRNAAGDTPLHSYMKRRFATDTSRPSLKGLNLLLKAGADPNLRDGDGKTATDALAAKHLSESSKAGILRDKMIQHLVAKDAASPVGWSPWKRNQRYRYEPEYPLHDAAEKGDVERLKELLEEGRDVNAEKPDGETPLYAAVGFHGAKCVIILLDAGARVDARKNVDIVAGVKSPLFAAVWAHNLEVFRILLDRGADINACNGIGVTLLHVAAHIGNTGIAELLLDNGFDVDVRDKDGNTPLHAAAENNRLEMAGILLSRGADIHAVNGLGNTPLHCAMKTWPPTRRTTRDEIVTLLLNTGAGTDIHARNGWDATPLHFAAERADVQVIALLVNECDGIGDVINRRNAAGDTPLHIYLRGQFRPVVAGLTRLLEAGADPGLRDGKGLTPIDILQARDGAASLHAALIKLLLDYGCPEQAEARFQRQHPGSCRAIVLPS